MESFSHTRQGFDAALKGLEHDLLEMGSLAEAAVDQAVNSLVRLDTTLAMEVIEHDDEIDEMQVSIENECIRLLALQHPMASDLRTVGTAMRMITDIERIGDLAVDLAKITLKIERELGTSDYIDIRHMANLARAMLREALEAYVRRDEALVTQVCEHDDAVDDNYRELRGQIHDHMRSHPDEVVSASWLILAIHHLERIADHAVNIAERVHFMITGRLEAVARKTY
jgi:phosphate transport system protein